MEANGNEEKWAQKSSPRQNPSELPVKHELYILYYYDLLVPVSGAVTHRPEAYFL